MAIRLPWSQFTVLAALAASALGDLAGFEPDAAGAKDPVARLAAFLDEQDPKNGPSVIVSDSIRKAYPERVFMAVWPSLLVFDREKRLYELRHANDFNDGLAEGVDRRIQVAAVTSLMAAVLGLAGPTAGVMVEPDRITSADGRTFHATITADAYRFTTVFDEQGKVKTAIWSGHG
jgi:hypothetical protein